MSVIGTLTTARTFPYLPCNVSVDSLEPKLCSVVWQFQLSGEGSLTKMYHACLVVGCDLYTPGDIAYLMVLWHIYDDTCTITGYGSTL